MKRKTTTTASKTTGKAKTTPKGTDATGAKLDTLQRKPTEWEKALHQCVIAYDTDEKLRAKLQRQYDAYLANNRQRFCVDDQRDGIADPVDKIHPPESMLNQIKIAIEKEKEQHAISQEKYKKDLEAARNEETFLEKREAELNVKWGTDELLETGKLLYDMLIDAGALALSLRAPCYTYADTMRPSRNTPEEKRLFNKALWLFWEYPPQARRDAYLAKTKAEREKILTGARIAEGKELQARYEAEQAKRKKEQEERKTVLSRDNMPSLSEWARSQGVSEYVHGDHVTWGGDVWRFTSENQWRLVQLALTSKAQDGSFEEPKAKAIEHAFGGEYRYRSDSPQLAFFKHLHKVKRGEAKFHFKRESKL